VQHAVDLDRGDRGTLDGRQQNTAKRVTDRGAEAALERLRVEPSEPVSEGVALEFEPLGTLENLSRA
jgi:hypothetical protein